MEGPSGRSAIRYALLAGRVVKNSWGRQVGPRWSQGGAKMAQDGAKMAPRRAKMRQDGAKVEQNEAKVEPI